MISLQLLSQNRIACSVIPKERRDRWGSFKKIRVDITCDSSSFIADMENAGIDNAEGVIFCSPKKSEMASVLKKRMQDERFFYPMVSWEKPCHSDICNEFNVERYALSADGGLAFSHLQGTHDDVFWASALSVYGTCEMSPEPYLAVVPRIARWHFRGLGVTELIGRRP